MNGEIAHRGPDGEGQYDRDATGDTIGAGVDVHLAHRRLSIIDLSSAADQPFVKDGLVLVFNGEIYNYRSLRAMLEATGVRFRTSSDTEVLLEAWRAWGPDSLRRLRGMFAFALYDERTGHLVLARDHFGQKPLFYTRRGDGGLAFCSELKGLVAALDGTLQVDPTALVASMMYYWVPEEHCAIQGVHKLPAGSWAEAHRDGSFRTTAYFQPQHELGPDDGGVSIEELREILKDSIEAHLVADVPVSSFLSGGLDSSLITVVAKRANPNIDAYTIRFRPEDQKLEAMPDDPYYARMVARQEGIELHEIEIAPNVVEMLPSLVHHLDEPIGDAAAINTVLICRAARQAGVKVLLSGMGADEIFGGYRKHYANTLAAQYRKWVPGAVRGRVVEPFVRRLPVAVGNRGLRSARWAKRFTAFASLPEAEAFQRSYSFFGREDFAATLAPQHLGAVQTLVDEHTATYFDTPFSDPVNRMCLTDVRMFLAGLNLTYTDRASMSESCEVRVPFVDVEVVRAAFRFRGAQKIDGRERKAPLKAAAAPWLPKEVIYRPKGLFSAPLRAWIRRDLQPMINEELLRGELVGSGFLQAEGVRALVTADRDGREDRSKELWQLLTLELWYRHMRRLGARPL